MQMLPFVMQDLLLPERQTRGLLQLFPIQSRHDLRRVIVVMT